MWNRFVVSSLTILAACSGGGGDGMQDAGARAVVNDTKQLLVGEIAEGILTGGPGDVAVISIEGATLDWNLHGHADGSTQTIMEELGVTSVHYTFTPAAQAAWYLLLRNREPAPVTVQVEIALHGDIEWSGWQ